MFKCLIFDIVFKILGLIILVVKIIDICYGGMLLF